MIVKPLQILNWYTSTSDTFEVGFYRNVCPAKFPILADLMRLLPFQIQRTTNEYSILEWVIIDSQGNETDMTADIPKLTIYEFDEGFEQIIYDVQLELSTTLSKGLYYMKIRDAANTWYSDWFVIDNLNYAIYGYGSFSNGFSSGFEIESAEPLGFETNFAINAYNFKDFNNLIYQFGYQNIIAVDDRHTTELNFIDKKETSIIDRSTGKEVINNIYNLKNYKLEFYHNIKIAEFCVFLEMMDRITITNEVGEEFTPINFEIEIKKTDNEKFYKIGIGFDRYYTNRNNCNQDY